MLDKRQNFSPKTKDREYKEAGGRCRIGDCRKPLSRKGPGAAQFHHIIPTAVGGTNELKNCLMLCPDCHARNTKTVDRPALDKTRRILKKAAGTTRRKAKIPSRPMAKSARKIPSRPFQKRAKS
jgi:5-methylcytosine-specific restriction endonuclease McrA